MSEQKKTDGKDSKKIDSGQRQPSDKTVGQSKNGNLESESNINQDTYSRQVVSGQRQPSDRFAGQSKNGSSDSRISQDQFSSDLRNISDIDSKKTIGRRTRSNKSLAIVDLRSDDIETPDSRAIQDTTSSGKTIKSIPSPTEDELTDTNRLCPPALTDKGFSINEQIGDGGFSKVYKARYKKLGPKVIAVKVIMIDKVPAEWREKRMKPEMKIMRQLKHPNIIRVWEVFKTRSRVFIFMDFAERNSVHHEMKQVRRQPYDETTARMLFSQVAGALCYMHKVGFAHRDIKNENILLDRDYNAKLTDFGFACAAYDPNKKKDVLATTQCGTRAYSAPEVYNESYDPRLADIWSLGVCLFEMVTNDQPFDDSMPVKSMRHEQMTSQWKIPSPLDATLSPNVQNLIRQLLEPNPKNRIKLYHRHESGIVNGTLRRMSSAARMRLVKEGTVFQHPWLIDY